MKVLVLEDFTYSLDGFTILKVLKGDTIQLDNETYYKFLERGHVSDYRDSPVEETIDIFSPVEETAVIEPVKEKKRRRKKKAE